MPFVGGERTPDDMARVGFPGRAPDGVHPQDRSVPQVATRCQVWSAAAGGVALERGEHGDQGTVGGEAHLGGARVDRRWQVRTEQVYRAGERGDVPTQVIPKDWSVTAPGNGDPFGCGVSASTTPAAAADTAGRYCP